MHGDCSDSPAPRAAHRSASAPFLRSFFLLSNLKLPWCNPRPFPLILWPLHDTGRLRELGPSGLENAPLSADSSSPAPKGGLEESWRGTLYQGAAIAQGVTGSSAARLFSGRAERTTTQGSVPSERAPPPSAAISVLGVLEGRDPQQPPRQLGHAHGSGSHTGLHRTRPPQPPAARPR